MYLASLITMNEEIGKDEVFFKTILLQSFIFDTPITLLLLLAKT
jgi:hypothetical protein